MLSICIPVYDYPVEKLIKELSKQCVSQKIEFEIIILEDGSEIDKSDTNKKLNTVSGVQHIHRNTNLGRSITRNQLADTAKYGKLIFIDCDSEIPSPNYIKNFIDNIESVIVCGGTMYTEAQKQEDSSLRLTYGFNREMIGADKRNQQPNNSFTTNNFMVSKSVFENIRFREFLTNYGHEDSLFGYELKTAGINIKHIDNPVIHIGIETSKIFLEKTFKGIENLLIIEANENINTKFLLDIKIVRAYNKFRKLGLIWQIRLFYKLSSNTIEKHLINSSNPSLLLFDFVKLAYYSKIKQYEKRNKKPY